MTRSLILVLLVGFAFTACYSVAPAPVDRPLGSAWNFPITQSDPAEGQDEAALEEDPAAEEEPVVEPEDEDERSLLGHILLYLPNRIVDLFDIVRAGVSVGIGIGVDVTATEALNATLMTKACVGLGYQTLRHSPIEAATYAGIGLGPFEADAEPGLSWHRSPGDIRVDLFVLLVGAHVAVEPFEIFDFIVGFLFLDPMDDTF